MGFPFKTLKREFVKDVEFENVPTGEDLIFMLDVIKPDMKMGIVNEHLYNYLIRNSGTIQSFNGNKCFNRIKTHQLVFERTKNKIDDDIRKADDFHFYSSCLDECLTHHRIDVVNKLLQDEYFASLNTEKNYRKAKMNTKSFKYKVAYFILHKKMFKLYSVI